MNKLVIVGNGFDLAHGLPTSYRHFIDSFWRNLSETYTQKKVQEIVFVNPKYEGLISGNINSFKDLFKNFESETHSYNYDFDKSRITILTKNGYGEPVKIFEFKNRFFKQINLSNSINHWVDIENEYYLTLKAIYRKSEKSPYAAEKAIEILNKEFEEVKGLLENYLTKEIKEKFLLNYTLTNHKELIRFFEVKPRYLSPITMEDSYLNEFPKADIDELLRIDERLVDAEKVGKLPDLLRSRQVSPDTIFLNFNYTNTLGPYVEILKDYFYDRVNCISIHGSLNNKLNKINFGFGDEMDEDYKSIESLNDNEFLKNFKSFLYLQNSNYKNLLNYIDSNKFQVYIFGHSCGLSDRTLLNTIFEHEYCRSIKVFYHQREDGSDNYTEIIQNISRHFNDKKLMRSKIVNKSLCQPLPQNIRFKKKVKV